MDDGLERRRPTSSSSSTSWRGRRHRPHKRVANLAAERANRHALRTSLAISRAEQQASRRLDAALEHQAKHADLSTATRMLVEDFQWQFPDKTLLAVLNEWCTKPGEATVWLYMGDRLRQRWLSEFDLSTSVPPTAKSLERLAMTPISPVEWQSAVILTPRRIELTILTTRSINKGAVKGGKDRKDGKKDG